jgi:hypothetical protein
MAGILDHRKEAYLETSLRPSLYACANRPRQVQGQPFSGPSRRRFGRGLARGLAGGRSPGDRDPANRRRWRGNGRSIHDALAGRWVTLAVRDPIGRTVEGRYAVVERADGERLAVMEMSNASGFSLVRGDDRNLLRGNTFGTGQLLAHALRKSDADRVVVGIGGSATNDGGIGMAAALGFRFLDAEHCELEPTPERLPELASIESPTEALPGAAPGCLLSPETPTVSACASMRNTCQYSKGVDLRPISHQWSIERRNLSPNSIPRTIGMNRSISLVSTSVIAC